MRLHLLLMCMQNGIEEPWQRIPSVIALFVAETSLILLDPSHEHYSTLNKHLMDSSRINMKVLVCQQYKFCKIPKIFRQICFFTAFSFSSCYNVWQPTLYILHLCLQQIPLFHDLFHSSAVNFRTQQLWMLRLAYAGLNLEDDAWLYIRSTILETLMSFYASPLSDIESKKLILQVIFCCYGWLSCFIIYFHQPNLVIYLILEKCETSCFSVNLVHLLSSYH